MIGGQDFVFNWFIGMMKNEERGTGYHDVGLVVVRTSSSLRDFFFFFYENYIFLLGFAWRWVFEGKELGTKQNRRPFYVVHMIHSFARYLTTSSFFSCFNLRSDPFSQPVIRCTAHKSKKQAAVPQQLYKLCFFSHLDDRVGSD